MVNADPQPVNRDPRMSASAVPRESNQLDSHFTEIKSYPPTRETVAAFADLYRGVDQVESLHVYPPGTLDTHFHIIDAEKVARPVAKLFEKCVGLSFRASAEQFTQATLFFDISVEIARAQLPELNRRGVSLSLTLREPVESLQVFMSPKGAPSSNLQVHFKHDRLLIEGTGEYLKDLAKVVKFDVANIRLDQKDYYSVSKKIPAGILSLWEDPLAKLLRLAPSASTGDDLKSDSHHLSVPAKLVPFLEKVLGRSLFMDYSESAVNSLIKHPSVYNRITGRGLSQDARRIFKHIEESGLTADWKAAEQISTAKLFESIKVALSHLEDLNQLKPAKNENVVRSGIAMRFTSTYQEHHESLFSACQRLAATILPDELVGLLREYHYCVSTSPEGLDAFQSEEVANRFARILKTFGYEPQPENGQNNYWAIDHFCLFVQQQFIKDSEKFIARLRSTAAKSSAQSNVTVHFERDSLTNGLLGVPFKLLDPKYLYLLVGHNKLILKRHEGVIDVSAFFEPDSQGSPLRSVFEEFVDQLERANPRIQVG